VTLPTLSITEARAMTALRTFLLGAMPTGTEVFRGEVNRVPEPRGTDFIVMWPIFQRRLGTNETTYQDNIVTASIAGTVMSVTAVARGGLADGVALIDAVWPTMNVAVGTRVLGQLTGSLGGTGTYTVTPTQTLASETLYAGVRADLEETELTVQLDIHGPVSGDSTKIIEALWRSEYATAAFEADGVAVAPLFADDARQMPFLNAEQQFEYRWTLDLHMEIVPIIGTLQQFADEVVVTTIEVDTAYPP
jgi:hypothetical protein